MPVSTTYPGVYLERLPSGVRSIAGVSTSVAAFLGEASRGPVGVATQVLNFTDFTRAFGDLVANYDLGYAVRQFFTNGGSEAWIVRVAANPVEATLNLVAADSTVVLNLVAQDAGDFGNSIDVVVDWNTASPNSTFNLTLTPTGTSAPAESYSGLSMNSQSSKYVVTALSASSLVTATRPAGLTFTAAGTSASAAITDTLGALTAPAGQPARTNFRVIVNGLPTVSITLAATDFAGANNAAQLTALAAAIQTKVRAASTAAPITAFTCTVSGQTLVLTSGAGGENSSVQVLQGATNDAATFLGLGIASGGVEADGSSSRRPVPVPAPGTLTGAALAVGGELDAVPTAGTQAIQIVLDGGVADTIDIGSTVSAGADGAVQDKLRDIATRIQNVVRSLRGTVAYQKFTAAVDTTGGPALLLSSGTPGAGSSVQVLASGADPLADTLGLLAGATATAGVDKLMTGGSTQEITAGTTYASYVPIGAVRQGIYALDEVDNFNLMVLPGITDPATLSDTAAYCEQRGAFMIIDSPFDTSITNMVTKVGGPSLPKSINAAVYYPYIDIADPLNAGATRLMPPSGAIAGVFARTDTTRGVWKAPAGTDASIVGAIGVDYTLTDAQNGVLNPLGVNCIRSMPTFGIVNWGARTLRGSDEEANEYKYVPVSRTALYIEASLSQGLQWVVFEPNDEPLWSQIRLNVGAFMQGLFRQGAFAGASANSAYFVKCDSETTTPTDQSLGTVNIIVGFAPLRPAEFVIIQLQQIAGQATS